MKIRSKVMDEFGYSEDGPCPGQWIEMIDAAIEAAVNACVEKVRLQGQINPENGGTFEMLAQAIEREVTG